MEQQTDEQHILDQVGLNAVVAAARIVPTFDKTALSEWAETHTEVYELGGQPFRMIVDRGENADHAIVVGGEFANGTDAIGAIARMQVVRRLVDTDATVILQPNSTARQDNMNFSDFERNQLLNGSAAPLLNRCMVAIDTAGNPGQLTAYGPSQGGVLALALGAHKHYAPPVAVSVVEAPNVVERSTVRMLKSYIGCGGDLKVNIAANFDDGGTLGEELIGDLSLRGLATYGRGAFHRDNRALLGIIRRGSAQELMQRTIARGGSVVHAWATGDAVSPAAANEQIAKTMMYEKGSGRYAHYTLDGDHSITNAYILNAALVHRARSLANV